MSCVLTTYTWDAVNRLHGAFLPTGAIYTETYLYNDLRLGQLAPTDRTTFVYDGVDVLTSVHSLNNAQQMYVHGHRLLSASGTTTTGGVTTIRRQFHSDAQGSVLATNVHLLRIV